MSSTINFQVLGIGAWGPGFNNWSDLSNLLAGRSIELEKTKGPKPEVIPANERRRAPLPVRLAVESSWQACQNAAIDPSQLASVFVSGLGDTQLTDYMCRTLAGDNKVLSPTKFHNSVHNAAAGYWTISTGCMQAANSVAGFEQSISLTLMDGVIQSNAEQRPILITVYDAPSSSVLRDLLHNDVAFSASIIVAPVDSTSAQPAYSSVLIEEQSSWPDLASNEALEHCYSVNPAAKILPLLKMVTQDNNKDLCLPISDQTSLNITKRSV